jgi:creatinine amidohydrolase/Fe(II)-dependent formamide hydrolase-like protein
VRHELGLLCFTAHPYRFGLANQVLEDVEEGFGIHAGEKETSVMLALAPDLVHPEQYVAELPPVRRQMRRYTLKGAASFGWLTRDLSRSGTIGDPRGATAEKGRIVLEAEARLVADLLDEALTISLDLP